MSFNKDMSDEAVLARYKKANDYSIVSHNTVCFNSLQDVFELIRERNKDKEIRFKLADQIIEYERIIEKLSPGYFDSKMNNDGN